MAGVLNLANINVVKVEIGEGGGSVFGSATSESFFTYVVDATDRTKYIFAHTYYIYGSRPTNTIINNNGLSFGANNSNGTQVVEGSSGNVIFYLICFI